MKKTLLIGSMAAILATAAGAGPLINWGSDYAFSFVGAPDCVDKDGAIIPTTSDWVVQLIRADTSASLFTYPNDLSIPPGAGFGFWEIFATAGVGYGSIPGSTPGLDSWNGMSVFTRIWAASTVGNPAIDWHADTTPTPLSWNIDTPPTLVNYNFGEVTQPMWVPEPGTGILVLAGAAVAIFRRRRTEEA